MAKAKRKDVVRHPSGRINVEEQQKADHRMLCELRLAINGLADVKDYSDNRAGYPLGRLCLRGIITPRQLSASNRFATIAVRWRGINGAGDLSAKAIDLNRVRGLSVDGELDNDMIIEIKAEYNNALAAMRNDRRVGQRLGGVVNIIRDAHSTNGWQDAVIAAVQTLEWYYEK